MPLQTTTLRPGYLVSLKTSLTGNVSYSRRDIEPERTTEEGTTHAVWETEKTVTDAAEHERGTKARNAARNRITRVCSASQDFGLLCPAARKDALDSAVTEARAIAADFNATARITALSIGVIVGAIGDSDPEAIKAINSEIRATLDDMESGLKRMDVEAVRTAARQAKEMGQMLSEEAAANVSKAIDAARSMARRIVKAGEAAAIEIDRATLASIATARTAFLDLDETPRPTLRDFTEPQARAIDLEPETYAQVKTAPAAAAPQLELI